MSVSVRLLITGMSATSVLLVALVTTIITLTTGLAALRSLGRSHAGVLRTIALERIADVFAGQTDMQQEMRNVTLSHHAEWGMPGSNSTTRAQYTNLLRAATLQPRFRAHGVQLYFADNTRVAFAKTRLIYIKRNQVPSPFSEFPNQTVSAEVGVYDATTHQAMTTLPDVDGLAEYVASTVEASIIRRNTSNDLWAALVEGTGNGRLSIVAPPIVAVDLNEDDYQLVLSMVFSLVTPLWGPAAGGAEPTELVGFVVSSQPASSFATLLQQARATAGTAAFILEGDGYLVGSSEPGPVYYEPTDGSTPQTNRDCVDSGDTDFAFISSAVLCRTRASEYQHGALRALASRQPQLLRPEQPRVEFVSLGSEGDFYVATGAVPLGGYTGVRLYLALLMPDADVIGDVVRGRNVAIGIVVGLVVVLAGANFGLVMYTLRPLDRIAERMVKAANLEDDGEREELSAMSEVRRLQEAYFEMNDELNRIRSYVPQTVLFARRSPAAGAGDDESSLFIEDSTTYGAAGDRSSTINEGHASIVTPKSPPAGAAGARASPVTAGTSSPGMVSSSELASSRSEAPGAVVHGPESLLRRAHVTVVAANVEGFHAMLGSGSRAAAEALAAVTMVVEDAVGPRSGVLTFHGDRFFATFNAARACASHGRRGVEAALAIAEGLDGRPGRGGGSGVRVRCGVATGVCTVGSVGSERTKAFSTLGPAFPQAVTAERLARQYGEGCRVLAVQSTVNEAQGACRYRYVDLVGLRGMSAGELRPTLVAALTPAPRDGGRDDDGGGGEWLYSMGSVCRRDVSGRQRVFEAIRDGIVPCAWIDAAPRSGEGGRRSSSTLLIDLAEHEPGVEGWGAVTDGLEELLVRLRGLKEKRPELVSTGMGLGSTPSEAPVLRMSPSALVQAATRRGSIA